MSLASRIAFRILNDVDRASNYLQGKGYGAATMKQEVTLLLRLLGATPRLAIDIGGNVGNYTAELRAACPQLEIHTFEPSATNLKKLHARFDGDPLVTLVPRALSDEIGAATLFSDVPGSGLGSLTRRNLDHLNIAFDESEDIRITRFEDYWTSTLGGRPLDLVKIDIEGHELNAFRGFGKALDQVHVLQFEFGGCNIDTRTFFRDFWYFFKDRDFAIYRVTPIGLQHLSYYRESDEFFSTTNYVAASRKHLKLAH